MVAHEGGLVRSRRASGLTAPASDPVANRLAAFIAKGIGVRHTIRLEHGIVSKDSDKLICAEPITGHRVVHDCLANALPGQQFLECHRCHTHRLSRAPAQVWNALKESAGAWG